MFKSLISVSVAIFLFSGCASSNPYSKESGVQNTSIGATVGAISGAILGATVSSKKDRKKGALIGTAVGSVIGGTIGYSLDNQAKEVANSLGTNVSKKENISDSIAVIKEDTRIKISIKDDMMFKTNSQKPTLEAKEKLIKLSTILKDYPQTIIQIIGHTDNVGSFDYNYRLSERRALAVSNILKNSKIKNEMRNQGCSFLKPLVQNRDNFSRGLNRRVEIYLYPEVKFYEDGCK